MLRIPYESDDFPSGALTGNASSTLDVDWGEIIWAALTVGRPNRFYAFSGRGSQFYEALFRVSTVRMALEQRSTGSRRIYRTQQFKRLDPTEKGMVSYFVGMVLCKLFSSRLLDTPWMYHVDLFAGDLGARFFSGRSRPDLIGKKLGVNAWRSFECKGRSSIPSEKDREKAKNQASRLVSVDGVPCDLHIGSFAYFHGDILKFYWRDPVPEKGKEIDLNFSLKLLEYYYAPIVHLMKARGLGRSLASSQNITVEDSAEDIEISIHPAIAKFLLEEEWGRAYYAAEEARADFVESRFQPDGLFVAAGESWTKKFSKNIDEIF